MAIAPVVALALSALTLAAPSVRAPSRIDAVTVFRSGARVTRVARVPVEAGDARVLLEGLPDGLDDDSIRVEGQGTGRARVLGVTVERITAEGAVAAEARRAEERLERLLDEDRAAQDRIQGAQARIELVRSLRSTYSEERAKNLAVRPVTAREWADLAAYVAGELQRATREMRAAEVSRRELARGVAQARAELEKVQAKRGSTTKTVTVEVEAERPGLLEVAVSYAVGAAGWQPIWDARLAPEASTVELTFLGSVWQRTGEDWSGVALSVSTAQPARGLVVPSLEPRWLSPAEPLPLSSARAKSFALRAVAAAPAVSQDAAEEVAPEAKLEPAAATVEEGLLSATFRTPRRETVDGSGQARTVPLARFPLKAAVTRTSAPRLEGAAFLTARATNETGVPLLPGAVTLWVGGEQAGRAVLPGTPPGGELELAFGADDRIEIERRVLERRHETAGLLSREDVWRYRVRIVARNRYAAPVALRLLDLVPVSRDGRIAVKVLEGTTAATREDPERPGVREWALALGAREEKAVELRYEVRVPRGLAVAGLE